MFLMECFVSKNNYFCSCNVEIFKMRFNFSKKLLPAFVALVVMPCCGSKSTDKGSEFYFDVDKSKYPIWGIDVSRHQSHINWESVSESGVDFVFVKATEGVTVQDPMYKNHMEELKRHNIIRGAYHFFSYKSTGKNQAKNFINTVKLSKGDLPPVLDVEFKRRMPSRAKIITEVKAWLKDVENHYKVKPIIYLDYDFYLKYLKGSISKEYMLWITDYYGEPDDWTFWQQTDKYRLKGVNTRVDRNVFVGSKRELRELLMN